MTGRQWRLTGRIDVPLPPGEAFRLFTPRARNSGPVTGRRAVR